MDQLLDISVGYSFDTKIWKNKKITWSDLTDKLKSSIQTGETLTEFLQLSKENQLKIKDVGGYVGGYLEKGRRTVKTVKHRQIISLDVDFAHIDFWDDFTSLFSCAAFIHGSHKHSPSSPRLRLIIPLDRPVNPDEYCAISRKIAGIMGIEKFDNTTFQPERLMFWPSNPSDIIYYYRHQIGDFLNADYVLKLYTDWRDISTWPTLIHTDYKKQQNKQENPREKKGLIGLFCRTYSIGDCINTFLGDVYERTDNYIDRYTYKKGTSTGGLITYDDLFAYSHHGTDPCCNKLCNAYDLVRIHLFGDLDKGDNKKSSAKMDDLIKNDSNVKELLSKEIVDESRNDFSNLYTDENLEWAKDLEIDGRGLYISSAKNISTILKHDPSLRQIFRDNIFDNKKYIFGPIPWRNLEGSEPIKNVDYSGLRNYLEIIYGINSTLKIEDSVKLEFEKNKFHPIRDYFNSLTWDNKHRLDDLLIDYLGADDNIYVREATRKTMVGAVARVFVPGIKFDLVLTLVGSQGTGKSTFVKKIGKNWYSDTFTTVQGKESFEQLQGAWIIEIAELSGLKKAEVEAIKHFITKQEDTFRPAYERTPETFYRQCIFIGTTNNKDFLRDPSGNRRFIPIDINPNKCKKSVFNLDNEYIDQVWAEAYELFKGGEQLYMSLDSERIARIEQKKHSELDERKGVIEKYLNILLPVNWDELNLLERRIYLDSPSELGVIERDFVCIAEIWCECLNKEKENMDRYKTRELNEILRTLEDWEQSNSTKNFKIYGKQKFYYKKLD